MDDLNGDVHTVVSLERSQTIQCSGSCTAAAAAARRVKSVTESMTLG